MKILTEHLEAVVVAMLAVNQYPLTKAWNLLPQLKDAGLTAPETVVDEEIGRLTVRLAESGYDRGLLTELFAHRIQHLMKAAAAGELDAVSTAVSEGDEEAASVILQKVKGIGPVAASTAWQLMK